MEVSFNLNHKCLFHRFIKRSHHGQSSKSNGPDLSMNNDADKDACFRDILLLHKTWLNITRKIENIRNSINHLRQGFVTMTVSKKMQLRINGIDKELSGIMEAITIQQKLTGYEYALGDIIKQEVFVMVLSSFAN